MKLIIFPWVLALASTEPIGFQSGDPLPIASLSSFPDPGTFFKEYLIPSKPVLFKGAAKGFPAYAKWTDSYFKSLPESKSYSLFVEEGKKENRDDGSRTVSFYDFLDIYKSEDVYCVNEIPPFLRRDIPIPRSIACPFILDSLMVDNVMWFSSGGTRSVWHNDGYENINCLFRGKKQFIMADKAVTTARAHLDVREGAYSTVDVDDVDVKEYPGLSEIQFYSVTMEPGDCLYIPVLWFHHVASTDSNLAANIWWRTYRSELKCDATQKTLDDLRFMGGDDSEYPVADQAHLAIYLHDYMYDHNHTTPQAFLDAVGGVLERSAEYSHVSDEIILWLFAQLDTDGSSQLEYEEIDRILSVLPSLLAAEESYLGTAIVYLKWSFSLSVGFLYDLFYNYHYYLPSWF